jgi:hypothetical protein
VRGPRGRDAQLLIASLIAAGAVVWTYWPAFSSYLIDDDFQWIDGAMQLGASRALIVTGRTHFYRPIVELYFGIMYALFGCSVLALHVASVCIHIVNAWLVMLVALRVCPGSESPEQSGADLYGPRRSTAFASLAGILFAVQPGPAQAVLWPSAVGTLLSATFGLLFLLADTSSRTTDLSRRSRPRRRMAGERVVGVLTFAAAMGAHESGIMWLPAAVLIRYGRADTSKPRALARHYAPALFLLFAYAGLTAWINSRNYVITEGQYRPGAHVITNLLMYLVSLYAGRQRFIEYAAVTVLIVIGLWLGTHRVRAWCLWLIAALLPVLSFVTPPSSRYLYVSAIPFSFLAASGIVWISRTIRERSPLRSYGAAVTAALLLTTFVAGRSALFARKGAEGFRHDASRYFDLAARVNRPDTDVSWIQRQYLDPLARVATCNPRATYPMSR